MPKKEISRELVRSQLDRFLEKAYRKSKSEKSKESYFNATYLFCKWLGKTPKEIIAAFKKGDMDVYRVLDYFVGYLSKQGSSPHTIKDYLTVIKRFLRVYDIEIINERLREKIDLHRAHVITQDRVPTQEKMKAILYSTDIRGKAIITMLASSGMRIGELVSLRIKDVDFSVRPTTIRLRAEITKDRQARICFISDEATNFLKGYLNERINNPEAYIFQGRHQGINPEGKRYARGEWENKPMTYWNADIIFTIAVKKAGIHEKDEHGRDIIHLHCLRKYFFTQMIPTVGREITEALMGHKQFYDSAYRRFAEDQMREHYLKGMKAVTILAPQQVVQPLDVRSRYSKH